MKIQLSIIAQAAKDRGELRQVETRTTAGAARGAIREHLACAQAHQGSWVDAMGRSEGTTRTSRVELL